MKRNLVIPLVLLSAALSAFFLLWFISDLLIQIIHWYGNHL